MSSVKWRPFCFSLNVITIQRRQEFPFHSCLHPYPHTHHTSPTIVVEKTSGLQLNIWSEDFADNCSNRDEYNVLCIENVSTLGWYQHLFHISQWFNTLRQRQHGRHFTDDSFKCIFLNENVIISIKISMKFVPKGPINNIPALVQIMAWRRPGNKPLSEAMMVSLLTYIYASLCLNELTHWDLNEKAHRLQTWIYLKEKF